MSKVKEFFKKLYKKIKRFLKKPGMFSKFMVIFCIAYCVRITEWGIHQFEISNTEAVTLITAGLALFGGELLLLCIKRTFAKADNKKISYDDENNELDISIPIPNVNKTTKKSTASNSKDDAVG